MIYFDLKSRMSLQYDPDFVAEKVVLLESDLKEVGERFITGTSEMLDLKSHLSDRNAQLRSEVGYF